jgi:hypothetical protein
MKTKDRHMLSKKEITTCRDDTVETTLQMLDAVNGVPLANLSLI